MQHPNRPNVLTRSLACLLLATASSTYAAALSGGDIIVQRLGDGTAITAGSTAPVNLFEYAPAGGSPLQTFDLTAGVGPFSVINNSTAEGFINFASDGSGIVVPGYSLASGTASATGTANARKIVTLSLGGNLSSVTLPSGTYAGNFRSVTSTGGANYWTSSSTLGVGFTDGTVTPAQVSSTITNARHVEIYGTTPQLYVSSGAGSFIGINVVGTGTPTNSGNVATNMIATGAGASPYGFFLFDSDSNGSPDEAWIADDRTAANGGIQRWNLNPSNSLWELDYALRLDLTSNTFTNTGTLKGLHGLAASVSGGIVTLAATTGDGSALVTFTDTVAQGADPTTFTTLATAGTNNVFRGVEIVPQAAPEPATIATLIGGLAVLGLRRRNRRA